MHSRHKGQDDSVVSLSLLKVSTWTLPGVFYAIFNRLGDTTDRVLLAFVRGEVLDAAARQTLFVLQEW